MALTAGLPGALPQPGGDPREPPSPAGTLRQVVPHPLSRAIRRLRRGPATAHAACSPSSLQRRRVRGCDCDPAVGVAVASDGRLRPGDEGFIMRARVPQSMPFTYTVPPPSAVDTGADTRAPVSAPSPPFSLQVTCLIDSELRFLHPHPQSASFLPRIVHSPDPTTPACPSCPAVPMVVRTAMPRDIICFTKNKFNAPQLTRRVSYSLVPGFHQRPLVQNKLSKSNMWPWLL
jgi:hypothetical protein